MTKVPKISQSERTINYGGGGYGYRGGYSGYSGGTNRSIFRFLNIIFDYLIDTFLKAYFKNY